MEILQFIVENWEVLSAIVAGTGALGWGSAKGVKAYQKLKDDEQDKLIKRNRKDIDKLNTDKRPH